MGDLRRVRYPAAEALMPDLKGFRYLARLLAQPDRELHVLDLVGSEAGGAETLERCKPGYRSLTKRRGRRTADGWRTWRRTSPRPRR